MARRGHGEGTISQRKDGRWMARIDLGYNNGKRVRQCYYGQTRKEVAEQLKKAQREHQQGLPVALERITVGKYLDQWLAKGAVLLGIRPSTHDSYCQCVRLYLKPGLEKIILSKLTPVDLNRLYAKLLKDGLSPRTVQYSHSILNRALKDAVKEERIVRNPAASADTPRITKKEMAPPTQEQVSTFLTLAKTSRFFALYVLAPTCGLREGELLGLKWPDLKLDEGELHVRRTIYPRKEGGGFYIHEPKTAAGKRMIALPKIAVEALRDHRAKQLEERLAAGPKWQGEDWVFPNTEGKLVNCRNLVLRSFKPLLEQAGLPASTRFHDLRHSMATLMLEDGTHPKVVQERLGHSTIGTTMDTYSHVKPKLQKEAASHFDAKFGHIML